MRDILVVVVSVFICNVRPSERTEQDVEAILKELSNIDGVSQMLPMVGAIFDLKLVMSLVHGHTATKA